MYYRIAICLCDYHCHCPNFNSHAQVSKNFRRWLFLLTSLPSPDQLERNLVLHHKPFVSSFEARSWTWRPIYPGAKVIELIHSRSSCFGGWNSSVDDHSLRQILVLTLLPYSYQAATCVDDPVVVRFILLRSNRMCDYCCTIYPMPNPWYIILRYISLSSN